MSFCSFLVLTNLFSTELVPRQIYVRWSLNPWYCALSFWSLLVVSNLFLIESVPCQIFVRWSLDWQLILTGLIYFQLSRSHPESASEGLGLLSLWPLTLAPSCAIHSPDLSQLWRHPSRSVAIKMRPSVCKGVRERYIQERPSQILGRHKTSSRKSGTGQFIDFVMKLIKFWSYNLFIQTRIFKLKTVLFPILFLLNLKRF